MYHPEEQGAEFVELVPLYDLHFSTGKQTDFCRPIFEQYVKYISDNANVATFLGGDILNTAVKDSLSFTHEGGSPFEEFKACEEILGTIKSKIIGLIAGNHERRVKVSTSYDICELLADKLSVPYFGDSVLLSIVVGETVYHIHCVHGTSSSRTAGGKINAAMRGKGVIPNADIYLSGHTHGCIEE